MGISNAALQLLMNLRYAGYLRPGSTVIEIGAQQLTNSFLEAREEVARLGILFGVASEPPLQLPQPTWILEGGQEHLSPEAPPAREFWTWLGFEYASIDIDGSPGSIPLDLNYDDTPEEARGHYDMVTNFGTTEHVANQLNAFQVIHDLAAPGGIMIHELPAQGNFNHGLLNYNFKFFWMLARSNNYKFLDARFDLLKDSYDLPYNIDEFVTQFGHDWRSENESFQAVDAGIRVVLQKRYDVPFVPPIDVETGTKTDHETLKERYWSVFSPDRLANLSVYERPPRRRRSHRQGSSRK